MSHHCIFATLRSCPSRRLLPASVDDGLAADRHHRRRRVPGQLRDAENSDAEARQDEKRVDRPGQVRVRHHGWSCGEVGARDRGRRRRQLRQLFARARLDRGHRGHRASTIHRSLLFQYPALSGSSQPLPKLCLHVSLSLAAANHVFKRSDAGFIRM